MIWLVLRYVRWVFRWNWKFYSKSGMQHATINIIYLKTIIFNDVVSKVVCNVRLLTQLTLNHLVESMCVKSGVQRASNEDILLKSPKIVSPAPLQLQFPNYNLSALIKFQKTLSIPSQFHLSHLHPHFSTHLSIHSSAKWSCCNRWTQKSLSIHQTL
jgi:hypothetical protein